MSKTDHGRRFILTFDGIERYSDVFVNGLHVKTQRFGYIGFSVDITEALNYGAKNVIAVRVNTNEGAEGWWYEGGGIYRHVWLEKCAPVHIPSYGVAIDPRLNDSFSTGTLQAKVDVVNESDEPAPISATIQLVDAKGQPSGDAKSPEVNLGPGETRSISLQLQVAKPALWSPDAPNLYTLKTALLRNGSIIDGLDSPLGFRTFAFDEKEGFLVNGKKTIIKGVCLHQDYAGVGIAVPDALLRYRLTKLKELGVNAIRTHHPNPPELARMCNEMGILLLAETRHFSCFSDSLEMLDRMVRIERNNPCVIAWGLGNEEKLLDARGAAVVAKMRREANLLDLQHRPVTMALNSWPDGPVAQALDVDGYNYNTIDSTSLPPLPIFQSEAGSVVCTRGEYQTDPKLGIVSSYDRKALDWAQSSEGVMNLAMTVPRIGGTFVWTGFDYHGEPTPYGWPNVVSNFGLLDLCGFRKDLSYYYEAWWSNHDVLHILPHWNWQGTGETNIAVWVFSNFDQVELLLNGKSLGTQDMPRYKHVEWKVPFAPGTLLAKGYRNGRVVAEQSVQTAGDPATIEIVPNRTQILADERDLTVFSIAIRDKDGNLCPRADNLLKFTVSGPGRMLGVGNGDPRSHEPEQLPFRKAFNGLAEIIVQSTETPGTIKLTVTSDGIPEKSADVVTELPEQTLPRVPSEVHDIEQAKFYPEEEKDSLGKKKDWSLEEMYKDTAGIKPEPKPSQ